MDQDKLFDAKGAAAYLGGVSPYSIHAWLSQGRLKRTKVGSRTMIRQSELDRFIQAGDGGKSTGRPRLEQPETAERLIEEGTVPAQERQ